MADASRARVSESTSGIHDRLVEVREAQSDLKPREMADELSAAGYSVSHSSVRDYEKGKARVPTDYAVAVCRRYGYAVAWLVAGEEPKKPVPIKDEVRAFRLIARIAAATEIGELERFSGE